MSPIVNFPARSGILHDYPACGACCTIFRSERFQGQSMAVETIPEQQLSYTRGPDSPLIEKTIAEVLRDTAARFPEREALVSCHQKIRLTWRELSDQVDATARGLTGLGLRPGDRAGVWATNCAEWV